MKISGRDKKVLFGGVAIVILMLLYAFGDAILPSRGDQAKDVDVKKGILRRSRETGEQEEIFKMRQEQYKARLRADQSRFISGDNVTIAGSDLMKIVTDLASQNQVEVIRRDAQREQKLEYNIVKIQVRIEANCSPEQLVRLLASIENHEKFLNVDELTINTMRIQKRVDIRPMLTVSAYLLVPETKVPESKQPG